MVRKPKMNYDPKMPGLEVEEAAPFNIEADDLPSASEVLDYIPPDGRVNRKTVVPDEPLSPTHKANPAPSEEYVPASTIAEREKRRKKEIVELAKKMYDEGKAARREYRNAAQIVADATEAQKKDPTPDLIRAMKIVESGDPMTKERVLAEAQRRYDHENGSEAG